MVAILALISSILFTPPLVYHIFMRRACLLYASKDDKEAAKQFKQLYSWMRRSRLTPMKDAADTLMNHEREILHYFHERLTNAVCEGINSMIQAAKRKARGYNTFEGFAAMIYLVAGKLELPVPDPF